MPVIPLRNSTFGISIDTLSFPKISGQKTQNYRKKKTKKKAFLTFFTGF